MRQPIDKNKYWKFCSFITLFGISSCSKLVEIPPPQNSITEQNVYTNNTTAIAVLTGIYNDMSSVFSGGPLFSGNRSISFLSGLAADEFTLYSGVSDPVKIGYYTNELSAVNPISGSEHWSPFYNFIFRCNAAIEGLNASSSLLPSIKQQLLGEAKFMRAFFYFYLINFYGDVPLALTTDYNTNAILQRHSRVDIYTQIISDLKDAQNLMAEDYRDKSLTKVTLERIRPTKWAAIALLARIYLYVDDFASAELQASLIISNNSLFELTSLEEVFLKNSSESIWQLQPTQLYFNTEDARLFTIPSTGPSEENPVYLSSQLLNSFELNDLRKDSWINSRTITSDTYYYPFKYKLSQLDLSIENADAMNEYLTVLRLGEQYLIRAEARTRQENIAAAKSDLNAIRARAGLPGTTANDKTSLLSAILNERQVELFSEWGHRWFDLKRTGNADAIMTLATPLKGGTWETTDKLFPILVSDILRNPNLAQNPGY